MSAVRQYDHLFKVVIIGDSGRQFVNLQIVDTAGQKKFRTNPASYYRGTHGIIVVYDVTNPESFAHVKHWLDEIEKKCDRIAKENVVLVGNKADSDEKAIDSADSETFASLLNLPFFETSAATGKNVEDVFHELTRLCIAEKQRNQPDGGATNGGNMRGIRIGSESSEQSGKKKCC